MTSIAWTDETWNPIIGCTHAAYQPEEGGHKIAHPGCDNYYAEQTCSRPFPSFTVHNQTSEKGKWTGRVAFLPERLAYPFERWKARRNGTGRRIFVASMSDMGHPAVTDEQRAVIYGAMLLSPWNIYQNLTKRPAELAQFKAKFPPCDCVEAFAEFEASLGRSLAPVDAHGYYHNVPLTWEEQKHIHELVSVSDQATANALIPELLSIPAAVHGISAEPLVGSVDLGKWIGEFYCPSCEQHYSEFEDLECTNCGDRSGECTCIADGTGYDELVCPGCGLRGDESGLDYDYVWESDIDYQQGEGRVNWVIIGGESGRRARPFQLQWARDLITQCRGAGVPVFMKQLGANADHGYRDPSGSDPAEWPEDLRVQQFPA